MTVKELKEMLNKYSDDDEVICYSSVSCSYRKAYTVKKYRNYKVLIIS